MVKRLFSFLAITGAAAQLLFSQVPTAEAQVQADKLDFSEIEWTLDSMVPKYNFPPLDPSLFDHASLNKYNFPVDSVPVYSAEVITGRLKDMGTMIPMEYNSDVRACIDLYTLRRRSQVSRMLGLQYIYFPMFEAELARQGLPIELKYLPVVESALNPHAKSRAGAMGLWQFMAPTGKLFQLDITSYVDERRDPQKSTEAAVRYLKQMYNSFGDWLLVIAAYNCGPGNVRKAILRAKGERDFWKIKQYLPSETRSYVPLFIAATYTFNYPAEHNLYPTFVDFNFIQDTVRITRQNIRLDVLAAVTKTDYYQLRDLNPELHSNAVPYSPEGYLLRVPSQTAELFVMYRDSIYNLIAQAERDTVRPKIDGDLVSPISNLTYNQVTKEDAAVKAVPSGSSIVYYKVKSGDVVGKIADRYGVSAEKIKSWNNLYGYRIKPGQTLKIYTNGKVPAASTATASAAKTAVEPATQTAAATVAASGATDNAKYHKVQSGDTLWDIANRYDGLTVEKLKSLNNLKGNALQVGQVLRVN